MTDRAIPGCRPAALLLLALALGGCGALVSGPAERTWVPSPNHDERRPNYVILHQTSNDDAARALRTLTDPSRKVSAHYLIGRDGSLYQLVDERRRAWHAGQSYWGGNSDLNSASIGIELDNNGEEPFPEIQIVALLDLLRDLKARYPLPTANFLGHGDVAPRRKADPSRHFPWQRLAAAGYGLWCRQPAEENGELPDPLLALQAIGYETIDVPAALRAFRRHFRGMGDEAAAEATAADRALLACLLREKLAAETGTAP